jgi:hypothetical protein
MSLTATVMGMVRSMNQDERVDFSGEFFEFIKDMPEFKEALDSVKRTTTTSPRSGGGWKGKKAKRPFSVRLVSGVDSSKPKIQQIEGQWVNVDKDAIIDGERYLITARLDEGKTEYILATGKSGSKMTFETWAGDHCIKGMVFSTSYTRWSDVVDHLEGVM